MWQVVVEVAVIGFVLGALGMAYWWMDLTAKSRDERRRWNSKYAGKSAFGTALNSAKKGEIVRVRIHDNGLSIKGNRNAER